MSRDLTPPLQPALETSLESVLGTLPDGIALLDRDWRIVYANDRARAISRLTDADLNSRTHWELFPETVGTIIHSTYNEVMTQRVERTLAPFYYEPFGVWVAVRVFAVDCGVCLHYRDVTTEVEAEQVQRTLEDQIRVTLDASNGIGMWDWDLTTNLVKADDRFSGLYGVDPVQGAIGAPVDLFVRNIHPEDIDHVRSMNEQAFSAGEFGMEYRLMQPDGTVRWVHTHGTVVYGPEREPVRFRGVALDITEQKQNEEQLRASEERYRVLAELNPQSLWTGAPDGRVVYANQRFLEYIGHDKVPRTGEEYIACFDPEDRERVIAAWTHSVVTGEDYSLDARLLRASDGASRWWHVWALPVRNLEGAIVQWIGLATDVHDERLATQQLREQYSEIDRRRREVETIYHSSPIGMALYEPKTLRLTRINEQQASIFGMTPEQAVGKTFAELTAGVGSSLELIQRAAAGETVLNQDIEGTLATRPEEHRFWNVNYSPIFAEDGTVQAIASATIETTRQKLAEQALIQSEKLAAVGRMASSIAHEINNPLESVTNLLYLARAHAVRDDVQTFLDLADQELRRVSIIANQTLRFHKQASAPQAISAVDLFATVLSLYEGRLKNAHIELDKRRLSTTQIACFEGDIRQVLNNLVGNAIDAMPLGGRLILRGRVATDWRTGRRGLKLTVADTGAGMSADVQQRIFEAFFTTKGIAGTGLGLWVSAEIVERHAGRLRLRSSQAAEHHGTVFALFLPFANTAERAAAPRAE